MPLDATVLAALLQSCAPNVAPATMVAMIRVESEGDPFRIGVNSDGSLQRHPVNMAEAIATARGLLRRGANFDAGLMQINSSNFARLGLAPETVFDPCTNLRAGSRVLAENYERARDAGHAHPLQAALSEYNTGSRSRGVSNGYVGKVYAAARSGNSPFAPAAVRPAVVRLSYGRMTPDTVGSILLDAFGGRITDTLRPMNATYGAEHSYHKFGQAVDFVPRGGVGAITREQIRALMAANGIEIVELLGPGDRGHSDHWHIAFATGQGVPVGPSYDAQPAWTVAVAGEQPENSKTQSGPYRVATELVSADGDGGAVEAAEPSPPAWDVFGVAAWQRRQATQVAGSGL